MATVAKQDGEDADPSIRFVKTKGKDHGTYPTCHRIGEIGKVCVECSEETGMIVGVCPFCKDRGRIDELCEECEAECYEELVSMGKCQNCDEVGPVGHICYDCEDLGVIFE